MMQKMILTRKSEKGFTMLEVVVAIMIIVAMSVMLSNAFAPWMHFEKRMSTEDRLNSLLSATDAMYRAKAYYVDRADAPATDSALFPGLGAMYTEETNDANLALGTSCNAKATSAFGPAVRDPADVTAGPRPQMDNLKALQPFSDQPMSKLAKDGFGNVLCVLVSPRISMVHEGYTLFYHVIAYVSAGGNHYVEPDTGLEQVPDPDGGLPKWTLKLAGDDKGVVFDGSKVVMDNFLLTKERLTRFARAYENYFKIRYQSRLDKNTNRDYFYANGPSWGEGFNGEPTQGSGDEPADESEGALYTYFDPGLDNMIWPTNFSRGGALSDTLAPSRDPETSENTTVADTQNRIARILGINDNDVYDAWGHLIIIDNASGRVRNGMGYAPFTAQFGSILPGGEVCTNMNDPTSYCPWFMTVTAAATY